MAGDTRPATRPAGHPVGDTNALQADPKASGKVNNKFLNNRA
jgi:hypothetical protein